MAENISYHEHADQYAKSMHDHYAHHDHEHDEYLEHHECRDFAKKGTANAALGLGIAGTVLGGAALLREGGFFGRGRRGGYYDGYEKEYEHGGCHHGDRNERHYEIHQSERISLLEAQLAQQSAERYASEGDCRTYKELRCVIEKETDENEKRIEKLYDKVCANDKELAVMQARTESKLECLNDKIFTIGTTLRNEFKAGLELEAERRECCCEKTDLKIKLEAERRQCGDEKLFEFMNCHFVRNKKVIPADEICPPVMPRFNCFDFDKVEECEKKVKKGVKTEKE